MNERIDAETASRTAEVILQHLQQIVDTTRELTPHNRLVAVEEEISPAISALATHFRELPGPEIVKRSCDTMHAWAHLIRTDSTGWWIYAERLLRHAKSLKMLLQVQAMGKGSERRSSD